MANAARFAASEFGAWSSVDRRTARRAGSLPIVASRPDSRVDIEIAIEDDTVEGPSTSGRADESGRQGHRQTSLSLTASLDANAFQECSMLVILYNLERTRIKLIAERVLELFDENEELARVCEAKLPGLTVRLRRDPQGAFDALNSFEVLLEILSVVDLLQADRLREEIKAMVSLHASHVGSREKEAMRGLQETPMWASISWRAMNAIVGWDAVRSAKECGDSQETAVLRLRCNSKTASQGLPMTVSLRIEVEVNEEVTQALVDRLSGSYFGKSLAQISTSSWAAVRLSREEPVSGVLRLVVANGDRTSIEEQGQDDMCATKEIQLTDLRDLESVLMALAYLTSDGSDGRTNRKARTYAVRDTWVPADGPIQISRSQGVPAASTYTLMVDGDHGKHGTASFTTMNSASVDGLIDVLDALRSIDAHFIGIV